MSNIPTVRVTTDIELSIEMGAKWFAGLDDDSMAQFLVNVEKESRNYPCSPDNQWYYLGGHLRNCSCVNEETRDMLRSWLYYMENSNHE